MKTLRKLYEEISANNHRWSYYQNAFFVIDGKWDENGEAISFIESYFDFAGKRKCFEDKYLTRNHRYIEKRAPHIISTFLLGVYLFECFGIDINTRDINNMNFKYYWFLTCLYHDIGYAYEKKRICEHLMMLQMDGLEVLQEICDIQYTHNRVFRTYSRDYIDLYLRGRSMCRNGSDGVIDHGIVGGLLLYDKLRRQFAAAWENRTDQSHTRQSFYIQDECRELHLSNEHYEAYAKAADAIIAHNIFVRTLNEYIDKYDKQNKLKKVSGRISIDNTLCFILSIADTIEPMKGSAELIKRIKIGPLPNHVRGIMLSFNEIECHDYDVNRIVDLSKWVDVKVEKTVSNGEVTIYICMTYEDVLPI